MLCADRKSCLDPAGIDKGVYRKWSGRSFRSSPTGPYELV